MGNKHSSPKDGEDTGHDIMFIITLIVGISAILFFLFFIILPMFVASKAATVLSHPDNFKQASSLAASNPQLIKQAVGFVASNPEVLV